MTKEDRYTTFDYLLMGTVGVLFLSFAFMLLTADVDMDDFAQPAIYEGAEE